MIIRKNLRQYRGGGNGIPRLSKWQRFKSFTGNIVRKTPKTLYHSTKAIAIGVPKAAIKGTLSGIRSSLLSPLRTVRDVSKTLYYKTKELSREAKRFIAYQRYKSAKKKLEKAQLLNTTSNNYEILKNKANLLKAKLKVSTGRVYETRKNISNTLEKIAKEVTGFKILSNGVKSSVTSLKKTAKRMGSYNIIGSEHLQSINVGSKSKSPSASPKLNLDQLHKQIQSLEDQTQTIDNKRQKAENFLKLERLQKQKQIEINKIQKIMKIPKYIEINNLYTNNKTNFDKNLLIYNTIINDSIRKIPTLGMFDSERARLQKQYDESKEMLKLYKVVEIVKRNPNLFSGNQL
jgi:hypothetical protein